MIFHFLDASSAGEEGGGAGGEALPEGWKALGAPATVWRAVVMPFAKSEMSFTTGAGCALSVFVAPYPLGRAPSPGARDESCAGSPPGDP